MKISKTGDTGTNTKGTPGRRDTRKVEVQK